MAHPHLPPLPVRDPSEIAGAVQALTAHGSCCEHAAGAHAPDGSCRVCQLQGRRPGAGRACTGWQPLEPADPWAAAPDGDVVEAEVLQPMHDAIAAVLADYLPPDQLERAVAGVVVALEVVTGDVAEYFGLVPAPPRKAWPRVGRKRGRVKCSSCGGTRWRHEEDVISYAQQATARADDGNAGRRLTFRSGASYADADELSDPRIVCDSCQTVHRIPEGVQVVWS